MVQKRKFDAQFLERKLDRRTSVWLMIFLVSLQIVGTVLINIYPVPNQLVSAINMAITVVTAMWTGWRLADAGYPRWLGLAGVFSIVLLLPLFGVLFGLVAFRIQPAQIMQSAPYVVLSIMFVLLIFLIWGGTRPSAPDLSDPMNVLEQKKPSGHHTRIEPKF